MSRKKTFSPPTRGPDRVSLPREGKTPLDLALEREAAGEIDYCDECEYVVAIRGAGYCGVCGKLLLPMMFERGQGSGPARHCEERKEARSMGLTGADLARLGPAAQKQVLEKLGKKAQEKERKYQNQPVDVSGIHFDSRKEANRYMELLKMKNAGMICNLRLQQDFTLQEAYTTESGERVRAIRYRADFVYTEITYKPPMFCREVAMCKENFIPVSSYQERMFDIDDVITGEVGVLFGDHYGMINGKWTSWIARKVVEDVKSKATRTAEYKMKKKLLRERFGLTITEV